MFKYLTNRMHHEILPRITTISGQFCDGFDVPNGTVSPGSSVREDTVVTVNCSRPNRYILIGETKVTCQVVEGWSKKPECRKCGKNLFSYNRNSVYDPGYSGTDS